MNNNENNFSKSSTSKKAIIIIAIIAVLIAVALLVKGITAYLTATDSKINIFTVGSVSINLLEPHWDELADENNNGIKDLAENITAKQTVTKDPQVENTGRNEAYVYLKVKVPKAKISQYDSTTSELFTYSVNEGWTALADTTVNETDYIERVYYYSANDAKLAPNATTPALFNSVTFANIKSLPQELQLDEELVEITAYAIQTNNIDGITNEMTTDQKVKKAYETYFTKESEEVGVNLEGKSALFIGDSVAYGQGNNGKAWSYYINQNYNLSSCDNVAVSGASWTYNSTTSTSRIINQYKNNTKNYDFVILEGGINDLTYGSTWGEVSTSKTIIQNSQIITEAMDEALNKATTKWPNSRIGYILLYNTEDSGRTNHDTQLDEYHNLIISICNKWNIPVFDMYSGKVIENNNEVTFDELLDVHNRTYLEDGLHLNQAGYEKTYSYIAEWMKSLPQFNNIVTNENMNQEIDSSIIAFGNLSAFSSNRYYVESYLNIGDIVDFASEELWNTYKFAIGLGTGKGLETSWIGGGYQTSAYTVQENGDYTIMVAKQDNSNFTNQDLEILNVYFGKKVTNNVLFSAFGSLSKISDNRYGVEPTLQNGDIVDFASEELWNTYKFAIGLGTGKGLTTSWIGGGYQTSAYTVQENGDYTIMVAKQDNSNFTNQDLEILSFNLGKK